jgi:colanic acid/amylovoran biosynthesis protein
MSRYPVSSSWLLNRPVMGDPLYSQMKQHNNAAGVMGRVKKVLRRRYQHQVLLSRVTDTGKLRNIAIAQGFTDFVRLLSGYDAIIQVGDRSLSISTACRSLSMRSVPLWPKNRCL